MAVVAGQEAAGGGAQERHQKREGAIFHPFLDLVFFFGFSEFF